jgi:hypothetical protein
MKDHLACEDEEGVEEQFIENKVSFLMLFKD